MTRPTHVISLNCTVADPDAWESVWNQFSAMASRLGAQYMVADVNVSSEQIPDEAYDEETMAKVRVALRESGMPEIMITDTINKMQNVGILFRERSS